MPKEFKSYLEQLEILKNRGLCIADEERAIQVLKRENYYTLINGYKELFINHQHPSEKFIDGTTFDEIKALYEFDTELKLILLKRILRVENSVKSSIAYRFSEQYGHDNYMKFENFHVDVASPKKMNQIKSITDLISVIQRDLANNVNRHKAIKHYMTEYGFVPLWVLVNILSLGTISKFYSVMKQPDQQSISRDHSLIDSHLTKILGVLTLIRNKCAHDERIFDFKSKVQIPTLDIHRSLNIPLNSGGQPERGTHDLFAVIISLNSLLDIQEYKKMIEEINLVIEILTSKIKVISIEKVYEKMGLPNSGVNNL